MGPDIYFAILLASGVLLFLVPVLPYLECGACGGFSEALVPLVAVAISGLLSALFWYWASFPTTNPAANQIAAGLSGVTALMGVSALVRSTGGLPAWVSQFGPWFFYGLGFFIFAVLLNVSATLLSSRPARAVGTAARALPTPPQALLAAPAAAVHQVPRLTSVTDKVA